jgi:MoaA/NifB/PqqE/SkfB family radical SAM enzyme
MSGEVRFLEKLAKWEKNILSTDRLNHYHSRLLQELALRTDGSFGKPTGVIILLTNRCNARCVHCLSWELRSQTHEMTTHEWEKTFDELRKWLGPIFISITGGETLLRKDSILLATYAAELGFWVEFLTNGYLMTPQLAEELVESGVKRIKISLDGSKPDIHDKIRGKNGFFVKATEALQRLGEEKNRKRRELEIWGKTTVMSFNMEDLPNIAMLVRQLGIDGVQFQSLEPVYYSDQLRDPKWYQGNPLWITDLERLSGAIQELRELKARGLPIINTIENLDLIENYFYAPEELAFKIHSHDYHKKDKRCRSWIGDLQILPDGGMQMCHWMNPFANAKSGMLKRAWRSRDRCWRKPCPYLFK